MERLSSGIPAFDVFLGGGLPWGSLVEWGLPFAQGGRELVLNFLAQALPRQEIVEAPHWALWVSAQRDAPTYVYPPAWIARQICLRQVRFARVAAALDIKPVFFAPFFRLIIIDGLPLSVKDFSFLARQARLLQKMIWVLRPYLLHSERGNVWARLRLNCQRLYQQERLFKVQGLRGTSLPGCQFLVGEK